MQTYAFKAYAILERCYVHDNKVKRQAFHEGIIDFYLTQKTLNQAMLGIVIDLKPTESALP